MSIQCLFLSIEVVGIPPDSIHATAHINSCCFPYFHIESLDMFPFIHSKLGIVSIVFHLLVSISIYKKLRCSWIFPCTQAANDDPTKHTRLVLVLRKSNSVGFSHRWLTMMVTKQLRFLGSPR